MSVGFTKVDHAFVETLALWVPFPTTRMCGIHHCCGAEDNWFCQMGGGGCWWWVSTKVVRRASFRQNTELLPLKFWGRGGVS